MTEQISVKVTTAQAKVNTAIDSMNVGEIQSANGLAATTGSDIAIIKSCIVAAIEAKKLTPVFKTQYDTSNEWSDTIPNSERDPANIFVSFKKL